MIQDAGVVDRLVFMSTVFKGSGWSEAEAAMISMDPEVAEPMKWTPTY